MKTRLFAAMMLLISIATFAQPSRRGESERRGQNNSDRRVATNQNEKRERSESQRQTVNNNFREDHNRINRDNNNNNSNNINRDNNHINRDNNNINRDNKEIRGNRDNRDFRRNEKHEEFTVSIRREPERDHATGGVRYRYPNRDNHVDYSTYHPYRRPFVRDYRRHYEPVEIRRSRFPYRTPVRTDIIWTNTMYRDYRFYYPEVHVWRYPIGHHIILVSAYDARDYFGEVATIYGKVADAYYNEDTDEYFLYFGDYFPNQDFSVIIPGNEARRFSPDPIDYFLNQHLSVTGYVNNFEGKPEIQIRSSQQIGLY